MDIALVVVGNSRAVEVDNSADSLVDTGLDSLHSSALWELPSRPRDPDQKTQVTSVSTVDRQCKHALRNGIAFGNS